MDGWQFYRLILNFTELTNYSYKVFVLARSDEVFSLNFEGFHEIIRPLRATAGSRLGSLEVLKGSIRIVLDVPVINLRTDILQFEVVFVTVRALNYVLFVLLCSFCLEADAVSANIVVTAV